MVETKELQWYVLRTIRGKEKKIKEYVETELRDAGYQEHISQVLIPTEKVYQIRNGKKISKERISYPGYVLIEAALVGEIPHLLRSVPSVLGFLGNPNDATLGAIPLRQSEVNRILGRLDEMAEDDEVNETPFLVGEVVKVNEGPFSTLSGIIEEVDNERKKLVVSVKIFGRKTPLELSFMQVEKE